MPAMTCRLRSRVGMPVGLATYPKETFLSLPREIRNKIYELLLSSSDPVIFLSSCSQPPLALELFKVNKIIATEAAAIFYSSNIFKITEMDDGRIGCWDQLYSFLRLIGPVNRASLRYLEMDICRPAAVSLDSHGNSSSLCADERSWLRVVQSQESQYTRLYPPVDETPGLGPAVDAISPAIEAVFRLLGSDGLKLQLTFRMKPLSFPELRIYHRDQSLQGWSGEVPNFVETMRRRYCTGKDGEFHVDILWKGLLYTSSFMEMKPGLQSNGWDLVEMVDAGGSSSFGPKTCFTLRRRVLDSWSPAHCVVDYTDDF